MGPLGPRCQPKAGSLACAGRRPAFMLVIVITYLYIWLFYIHLVNMQSYWLLHYCNSLDGLLKLRSNSSKTQIFVDIFLKYIYFFFLVLKVFDVAVSLFSDIFSVF